MIELNRIYNEDCLEGMKKIPDKSIDMILCDLPYGTTACKWDTVIPFDKLWLEYERIIKDSGAICLFGSEPFTSLMICSNIKIFRYDIVWDKVNCSSGILAKKRPLKSHENICVFYKEQPTYNPQMTEGTMWHRAGKKEKKLPTIYGENKTAIRNGASDKTNLKYPKSILTISNANNMNRIHPTQKPVELFEWLIKTYTNENDLILYNCIGSGTTAIACINTGRNFIGFELDKQYYDTANERVRNALADREAGI